MSRKLVQRWSVYIMKCADDTLYSGVTTDLTRRLSEHNDDKLGAKYTKARRPVSLMYSEEAKDRSSAQIREAQLKKMTRAEKLLLITKA